MKKALCMFLCLVLFIPSALAETAPVRVTEDDPVYAWLYEKALWMADFFDRALRSEFLSWHVGDSLMEYVDPKDLASLRAQDYTKPTAVTVVRADCLLASYDRNSRRAEAASADLSDFSYFVDRTLFFNEMSNELVEGILGLSLSLIDAFVCPEEMTDPYFVLLEYGGSYAYLAAFYPMSDGAALAKGAMISSRKIALLNLPK